VSQNLPDFLDQFDVSKTEGFERFLTVLNLIPDPAVLYDRAQDQILAANNAFFLLTNLEENEFLGREIHSILPNITDTNPTTGHGQSTRLRHKRQPLIQVTLRIFSLSRSSDQIVILFNPEGIDLEPPVQTGDQTELIHSFHNLVNSRLQPDIKSALQHVLQVAEPLLQANLVCIYKASGAVPELIQYLANDSAAAAALPTTLTSKDLAIGQDAELWTTDDLAVNPLQKAAVRADYGYLIAVPLGQQNARFGLFVAGGESQGADENLLPMAALIADFTAGLMEDQIALHNTRNLANKIKQVVKIQNEIIAHLEEGILILTPDLTVAEINQAAEDMLGYANVEALRQPVDNILIGSDSFGSALSSAREGYPTLISADLTLNHRNGRSFPAQVMTAPVMSNGKLVSIIVLIRDVSQAEASQAEKKQLEQRAILGEVTAIFAHEVRNPLNAITLALQVIEESLSEDDENMKWVRKIQEECDNLIELMESVLSFAKPLEYRMSGVDLAQMINQLFERWRPRFRRVNITPYFESEIRHPVVEGDQRALEQVFTNLISNAVNAMTEEGGQLSIKVTEADGVDDQQFYQINVTDTGPGIPADIKEHMFKPFITGSKHGTGLGLAITQRIVNAHKGKIEVDSYPGGTIFKVFLAKKEA
jgi:PAS domain S-box-containing protein